MVKGKKKKTHTNQVSRGNKRAQTCLSSWLKMSNAGGMWVMMNTFFFFYFLAVCADIFFFLSREPFELQKAFKIILNSVHTLANTGFGRRFRVCFFFPPKNRMFSWTLRARFWGQSFLEIGGNGGWLKEHTKSVRCSGTHGPLTHFDKSCLMNIFRRYCIIWIIC